MGWTCIETLRVFLELREELRRSHASILLFVKLRRVKAIRSTCVVLPRAQPQLWWDSKGNSRTCWPGRSGFRGLSSMGSRCWPGWWVCVRWLTVPDHSAPAVRALSSVCHCVTVSSVSSCQGVWKHPSWQNSKALGQLEQRGWWRNAAIICWCFKRSQHENTWWGCV